jgi:DNA polymerase III sliding clamp (beta) subunit (PCNA family)
MIFNKAEFKAAIDAVTPFAAKTSPLAILTHVKIESTGKRVTFTASQHSSQIEYWLDCEGEEFAVCLEAVALRKFAQFVDGNVKMTVKNKKATLEFGDTKTRLGALDATDYPQLVKDDVIVTELEWGPLAEKLIFAAQFCSPNQVNPLLNCVQLLSTGTKIHIFGTDGKSAGVETVDHLAPEFGICIPVDTARNMVGSHFKTLVVRNEQVELRGPNASAYFKLAVNKPMKIEPFLGRQYKNTGKITRKSLLEAISFVSAFSDSGKIRSQVQIHTGDENTVRLVGIQNEATAPFDYKGDGFQFGAFSDDFAMFLKTVEGDDLTIEFDKDDLVKTPVRLSDSQRVICTMPVRI